MHIFLLEPARNFVVCVCCCCCCSNLMLPYTRLLQIEISFSVLEPILVEDMNDECVPKTYENLRDLLENRNVYLDRNDIIVLLFYICMLEMGFVTKEFVSQCDEDDGIDFNYRRISKLAKEFPINWKRNNFYEFSFVLLPFPLYTCNLNIIKMADDMLINSNVRNIENCTCCMLIDPSLYVVNSSVNLHKIRFQNVRNLAITFKSKICYPMKIAILTENNVRVPHIQTLPEDILLYIASKLNSLSTLSRFQQVCQLFKNVTEEEKIWKRLIDIECKVQTGSTSRVYIKMKRANKKLNYLKSVANNKNKNLLM